MSLSQKLTLSELQMVFPIRLADNNGNDTDWNSQRQPGTSFNQQKLWMDNMDGLPSCILGHEEEAIDKSNLNVQGAFPQLGTPTFCSKRNK